MSEEANKHVRDKYRDLMVAVQDQSIAGEERVTSDCIHDMVKRVNEAFTHGTVIIFLVLRIF